jgi:hypothetical protein
VLVFTVIVSFAMAFGQVIVPACGTTLFCMQKQDGPRLGSFPRVRPGPPAAGDRG